MPVAPPASRDSRGHRQGAGAGPGQGWRAGRTRVRRCGEPPVNGPEPRSRRPRPVRRCAPSGSGLTRGLLPYGPRAGPGSWGGREGGEGVARAVGGHREQGGAVGGGGDRDGPGALAEVVAGAHVHGAGGVPVGEVEDAADDRLRPGAAVRVVPAPRLPRVVAAGVQADQDGAAAGGGTGDGGRPLRGADEPRFRAAAQFGQDGSGAQGVHGVAGGFAAVGAPLHSGGARPPVSHSSSPPAASTARSSPSSSVSSAPWCSCSTAAPPSSSSAATRPVEGSRAVLGPVSALMTDLAGAPNTRPGPTRVPGTSTGPQTRAPSSGR